MLSPCYGPSMNPRDESVTHCTNSRPCVHHGNQYPEPDSLKNWQDRMAEYLQSNKSSDQA